MIQLYSIGPGSPPSIARHEGVYKNTIEGLHEPNAKQAVPSHVRRERDAQVKLSREFWQTRWTTWLFSTHFTCL